MSSTAASERKRMIPWVEKYRPDRVADVSHQDEVVRTLKTSIELGQLPHLLFHGSPGTGKTTTILAVAKELYGPELYRDRVLELNASDERGIKVVREKIKSFAQGAVGTQKTSGYKCPRFKIIILDECDNMTPEAQSALRRIMEQFSRVTRFCLICNYVTRIIEPLASRCAKFRFRPLPGSSMEQRMQHIAQSEHVLLAPGALDAVLQLSLGDMRKAVTFLQSSAQLSGGEVVTAELVTDISGQVPPGVMEEYWRVVSGRSYDAMRLYVEEVVYQGYPVNSILSSLHDRVVESASIGDRDKALICEKVARVDQCLIDGGSEILQLLDLSGFIMRRLTGLAVAADVAPGTH